MDAWCDAWAIIQSESNEDCQRNNMRTKEHLEDTNKDTTNLRQEIIKNTGHLKIIFINTDLIKKREYSAHR